MGVLGYWILVPLAVIGWCALVKCVFSAAEQVPHIAQETLFGVGDEE